ncbi:Uncharacterized protein DBV15_06266 [Temnothorax longispinosus]|uniref:Uncharacterized protein n=1 Tax=Temnothorax longispinosus TaxID=300112 RepID=A0A4S2KED7_9HYME|nr:Uncharacterized protein DBV15_06266 [Temnothorax longispinosus]
MVHVFPRITWRSHVCTCARLVPWYESIVVFLAETPLLIRTRPPVADPSTATLGPPRKPAGYVVFVVVVFLGAAVIAHVDPARAYAHAHRRYLARTRKRFPHSDRDQIDEHLR